MSTFVLFFLGRLAKARNGSIDDGRYAFFSRQELLEQQGLLVEHELAEMGEELSVSREEIATPVIMWTGMRYQMLRSEKGLVQVRWQLAEDNCLLLKC
ncbi:hypothetical protein [Pseudomonas monteilii]|uniref:Uncharacterized protein n=1 Tax=Pseudomonas monteilii TaxID=76759 RepID=A0A399M522_9PSED|nr:hypothetical protein [Pseudomonas monteilii]RII76838.1 hypothetical protein D0894_15275 [Pseudomonas monteilii]